MNASPYPVSNGTLLAQLRRELAEARAELENPNLFSITRDCLTKRIARLDWEVGEMAVEVGEPRERVRFGMDGGR
jgi:hypothetical protein